MKNYEVENKYKSAYFAAGCFWCYETLFRRLKGVVKVTSGYTGGDYKNPSTNDIYYKDTGHAESVRIEYDPNVISYKTLVDIFWEIHDPTSLNKQGYDEGTIYRSAIFYQTDEELETIKESKLSFEQESNLDKPIVTVIEPFKEFFKAEEYHQNFYINNPNVGYCNVIIAPKVKKFYVKYADLIKEEFRK